MARKLVGIGKLARHNFLRRVEDDRWIAASGPSDVTIVSLRA